MNDPTTQPVRWWTPVALLACGPLAGIAIGAATNAVNVRVSPYYYAALMVWTYKEVDEKTIGQGMLEGGALGVTYGVLMAVAVVGSTRGRCPVGLALGRLARAVGIALACWVVGGVLGLVLAAGAPNVAWMLAVRPPYGGNESFLRYAWVGGSIVGGYVGTFVGLLFGAVSLHVAWKRSLRAASTGFAVGPVVPMARVNE